MLPVLIRARGIVFSDHHIVSRDLLNPSYMKCSGLYEHAGRDVRLQNRVDIPERLSDTTSSH